MPTMATPWMIADATSAISSARHVRAEVVATRDGGVAVLVTRDSGVAVSDITPPARATASAPSRRSRAGPRAPPCARRSGARSRPRRSGRASVAAAARGGGALRRRAPSAGSSTARAGEALVHAEEVRRDGPRLRPTDPELDRRRRPRASRPARRTSRAGVVRDVRRADVRKSCDRARRAPTASCVPRNDSSANARSTSTPASASAARMTR